MAFSTRTTEQLERPGLDIHEASIIALYTKHHALYVLKPSKSYSISSLSRLIKIIIFVFNRGAIFLPRNIQGFGGNVIGTCGEVGWSLLYGNNYFLCSMMLLWFISCYMLGTDPLTGSISLTWWCLLISVQRSIQHHLKDCNAKWFVFNSITQLFPIYGATCNGLIFVTLPVSQVVLLPYFQLSVHLSSSSGRISLASKTLG